MRTLKFPFLVKKGNVSLKIYRLDRGNCFEFRVPYYSEGKRRFDCYWDFDKARKRADEVLGGINVGGVDNLRLTGEERLILSRSEAVLQGVRCGLQAATSSCQEYSL
ncbi:hypothetical protein [Pedosphaera parvula]|uniref:Uncharacterized protein n=1 Tax=Pedosphaera parvula (strain Ellin514) TaxID=320771 RepID=B9XA33_PEDPL|nr:hypothetical protein [Pedosphaera parvula]EEF63374.1 hypothetical protein Cflav_PD6009 [Pedosphaera parvula Ellin514]